MTTKKKITLGCIATGGMALVMLAAYQPLKFQYARWRIESAKTPEQEREAFILATRVGRYGRSIKSTLTSFRRFQAGSATDRTRRLRKSRGWSGHGGEASQSSLPCAAGSEESQVLGGQIKMKAR